MCSVVKTQVWFPKSVTALPYLTATPSASSGITQHEQQWSIFQAAPVHLQGFTPTIMQFWAAANR